MLELIFKTRWISAIAVVFSALGATLMMAVGAVSTIDAIGIYFGEGHESEFSEEAALKTTTTLISSLDEFLLGLDAIFKMHHGLVEFTRPQVQFCQAGGDHGLRCGVLRYIGVLALQFLEDRNRCQQPRDLFVAIIQTPFTLVC